MGGMSNGRVGMGIRYVHAVAGGMAMILDQLYCLQFELITMPGEWHDHREYDMREMSNSGAVTTVEYMNANWSLNGQRQWRMVRTTTEVIA